MAQNSPSRHAGFHPGEWFDNFIESQKHRRDARLGTNGQNEPSKSGSWFVAAIVVIMVIAIVVLAASEESKILW
jgi:hypothetical protein